MNNIIELPLEEFSFSKTQMRTRDTGKDIEELADNIYKIGLLNPITVRKTENGKYEILAGQRRFLAIKKLDEQGRLDNKKIRAFIIEKEISESYAVGLSVAENMLQRDPAENDYIDACTKLFDRYGSIKAVSEELALPYNKVSKYVKVRQLRPGLKKLYKEGKIKLNTALHANTAVIQDGEEGDKKALELGIELSKMGGDQARRARQIVTENPNVTITQAAEDAKRQETFKVTILQSRNEHSALNNYADGTGQDPEEAAGEILTDGLISLGVLSEED